MLGVRNFVEVGLFKNKRVENLENPGALLFGDNYSFPGVIVAGRERC